MPNSGRHRSTTGSSANHRAPVELEMMEDDTDDSRYVSTDIDTNVNEAVNSDLTLLPILHSDFVQVLPSSASSADNWQVCSITLYSQWIFNCLYDSTVSHECARL